MNLRASIRAGLAALAVGFAGAAAAQPVAIGVAAPISGPMAILGAQVVAGATIAAGAAKVEVADDACTAAGGAAAAKRFVDDKVSVVVGFLCTEAIEAALPILKDARIPVVTPGVRTNSLTDRRSRTGWLLYRLAPRDDAEENAVAAFMPRLWRDELFAIIDDGTIYGRELAESFRAAAEATALKPVFVDTFRPQLDNQIALVGRLKRAGATHVFVGGERDDVAVMGRDAAAQDAQIVFAGGESLKSATTDVPLSPGTIMVGLPEWSDVADPDAVAELTAHQIVPEGYVLPAYAAMQVALALAAAPADAARTSLPAAEYQTAIGPVRFDDKGDLAENPFRLFSFDGKRFTPLQSQ